jgi:glucodextranase-like protein
MASRRSTHVRPRPASTGRPKLQPIKAAAPDRRRVRQHPGLSSRRQRTPLVIRTGLMLAVVLLTGGVLLLASGGIGAGLTALAGGFTNALNRLVATPVPTSTDLPPTDSPRITGPQQPYTNEASVDLDVSVPAAVLGDPSAKVRIYLALEGLEATPVVDIPVGTTSRMLVPFTLTEGRNDISATLFRGQEESDHSPIVTWVLDVTPPKISISSPKDGSSIDTPNATIKGSTQAGSTIIVRNPANNASISGLSGRDGSFELALPLVPGDNQIQIDVTDPAGNEAQKTLKLKQGSTDMRVRLSASLYQISVRHHPSSLQLTVLVTTPKGDPLPDARAFFTLQIPGLAPISNELFTGSDGRARFTTPLVGTLQKGTGVGTVLVSSDTYGDSTDRVNLTFVK